MLGDPLVVAEEIGYVLWREGDPAVVEQRCWWFVASFLNPLSGDHNGRKNDAQCYQEQHSQNYTDM